MRHYLMEGASSWIIICGADEEVFIVREGALHLRGSVELVEATTLNEMITLALEVRTRHL